MLYISKCGTRALTTRSIVPKPLLPLNLDSNAKYGQEGDVFIATCGESTGGANTASRLRNDDAHIQIPWSPPCIDRISKERLSIKLSRDEYSPDFQRSLGYGAELVVCPTWRQMKLMNELCKWNIYWVCGLMSVRWCMEDTVIGEQGLWFISNDNDMFLTGI